MAPAKRREGEGGGLINYHASPPSRALHLEVPCVLKCMPFVHCRPSPASLSLALLSSLHRALLPALCIVDVGYGGAGTQNSRPPASLSRDGSACARSTRWSNARRLFLRLFHRFWWRIGWATCNVGRVSLRLRGSSAGGVMRSCAPRDCDDGSFFHLYFFSHTEPSILELSSGTRNREYGMHLFLVKVIGLQNLQQNWKWIGQ